MAPVGDDRSPNEEEQIRREMELLEQHRPQIEARNRAALRGAIAAFVVMAIGLLLWWALR